MTKLNKIFGMLVAAAFAAALSQAPAQDQGGGAGGGGGTEAKDAPALDVKPRPAEIMPLAPKSLLLDIAKVDDHFVAVGERGNIILSPDGKTWTQAQVPVRAALTAVYFVDNNNGWAVGHDAAIVGTKDGGKTWALQMYKPELEKPFLDVLFVDATHGFAVGAYGLFYETSDGQTWTEKDAKPVRETEQHLNSITKLGDGELFIAGEAGLLGVSKDAGKTWEKVKSPYDASLFGALPHAQKGAVIFGLRGNVFTTEDVRSNKWTKLETNDVASMFGGTVMPDGSAVMVGLNGVILIADASGKVTKFKSPEGITLSAAAPEKDGGLLAVGEAGVQLIQSLKNSKQQQ